MKESKNATQIPDMITLCNWEGDGKTIINPSQVASLHDIEACGKYTRRTRVDMAPDNSFGYSHPGSFLVKEAAEYIRTAMDTRRARQEMAENK